MPQKAYLFAGTVASNLRFGRPGRDRRRAVGGARDRPGRRLRPGDARRPRERDQPGRHATCRADSDSGWRSPERWSCDPRSTCSTTRSRRSTSRPMPGCAAALEPRIADAARARRRPARVDDPQRRPDPRARRRPIGGHRHPRRTARDVPDLRRDRRLAACRGWPHERATTRDGRPPTARSSPPPARQARRGAFGPGGGVGVPVERSDAFGATVRRLGSDPRPGEAAARAGAGRSRSAVSRSSSFGPRLLGEATDIIVSGVTSGDGIDFGRPPSQADAGRRPLRSASWALAYGQAYILAGVVQRSMYALRESVESKIHRLPLELHRSPIARRPAQSGHERHRQPRPEPAADGQPDPDVAAHAGRRDGDDVHDLAAAGRRRAA